MCAYVLDVLDEEDLKGFIDREAYTLTLGRTVTSEAVRFFRSHSRHFADGAEPPLYLMLALLMVDGSVEKLKFLMMGADIGCGECASLAMDHLQREDPVREDPRPFLKVPAGTARDPTGHAATIAELSACAAPWLEAVSPTYAIVDAGAGPSLERDGSAAVEQTTASTLGSEIGALLGKYASHPVTGYRLDLDISGAVYVLSLLDKLDDQEAAARAAAPAAGQQAAPESETGWRRASKDDYGRAMREALEELAESDWRKVELDMKEHPEKYEYVIRAKEDPDGNFNGKIGIKQVLRAGFSLPR